PAGAGAGPAVTSCPDGNGSIAVSRAELEEIAARGGALALEHFRGATPERKADRTLVTTADRAGEAPIVGELTARCEGAGIVAGEGRGRRGRWVSCCVIDPIDGPAAFVAGLSTWRVCLGLMDAGSPRGGVVHLPCSGEFYPAVDGRAWWNGVALG